MAMRLTGGAWDSASRRWLGTVVTATDVDFSKYTEGVLEDQAVQYAYNGETSVSTSVTTPESKVQRRKAGSGTISWSTMGSSLCSDYFTVTKA